MKKKKLPPATAQIAAGHWHVSDPQPAIIDKLVQVLNILRTANEDGSIVKEQRLALLALVKPIVRAWDAHEDIAELTSLLGLAPPRGRRRTQRTVRFEYALAFAAAEQKARGAGRPYEVVATEQNVDPKTVRRAVAKWPIAATTVNNIRDHFPNQPIDYRGMFRSPDTK